MEAISSNILAFYLLSGMIVFASLSILFSKNIVHAIFLLVIVFVGIAGIYLISNAEFVGVTQIMIYVGGILILMMFGVMLTSRVAGQKLLMEHKRIGSSFIIAAALLIVLLYPLKDGFPQATFEPQDTNFSVTQQIGIRLMTTELLALEVTGILLLMALIGAAFLAGTNFHSKPEKP